MAKQSRNSRSSVAWALAVTILGTPWRALAEPPPVAEFPTQATSPTAVARAEAYAARAFEAYGDKRYAEAVELYRRAYDAAPSADALYNIARVYDLGLRDRPLAIAAYRRVLADAGATPERIRIATERLQLLREAELAATDADREPARDAGMSTAGMRKLSPPPTAEPAPGGDWSASQTLAVGAGALGVVSVAIGIGYGISVMADADTANASCVDNRCRSARAVAAAKSAATNATVATAAVSVGAGLIATGALLWVLGLPNEREPAPPGVTVTPLASASELGLTLSGGW
jgi:tetratricopeptide (TPR) repeat protein